MARKNPEVRMLSYGRYAPFDKGSKQLPRIVEFTTAIPVAEDVEFGYILRIRKGRGEKLEFRIDHPPFTDSSGDVTPPFVGEEYIRSSEYQFFLGDTFWQPFGDKVGEWKLSTRLMGREIASKTFKAFLE
jgi:hypothetical protein